MDAKPCLTQEEENEPVELLINWAMVKQGKKEVVNMVHTTVEKKGLKVQKITQEWWVKFCKRWPQVRLHKGDYFPLVRDKMANHSAYHAWWCLLERTTIML